MPRKVIQSLWRDKVAFSGALVLLVFGVIAIIGPSIAPYDPGEMVRTEDGRLARLLPPSSDHWLGTTNMGRDVFSQMLVGTRSSLVVGLLAGSAATIFGTTVGVVAGYRRGAIDNVLMRGVEVAYALPFEPFAIVILALFGPSQVTLIAVIALLFWRSPARVVRTQVLSIAEWSFVKSARALGCSNTRIMTVHILPNILPVALVYLPVAAGNAILAEAAISFLGFTDPNVWSWGRMLQFVFISGAMEQAWWWYLAPGLAIAMTVAAIFFVSRSTEDVINPRLRRI